MFKFIKLLSYFLVIVGALNWGLIGLFEFDLVAFLFGEMTRFSRIIYILVGISAIISPMTAYMSCKDKL